MYKRYNRVATPVPHSGTHEKDVELLISVDLLGNNNNDETSIVSKPSIM